MTNKVQAYNGAAFATAALEQPERFSGHSVELAAEALTTQEVAATLSDVTGRPITAVSLTSPQALAAGRHPAVAGSSQCGF